jgi:hypothetical protein
MASIAVNPFILKDSIFQVEADNYEAHVSQVEFAPTAPTATFKGLTPAAVFNLVGLASWVCNLAFAQDWATPNSLSRYLYEHEGEEIDVTFEPVTGGPAVTATLFVTPGSIGGTVDGVATSTVALPCKGKPVLAPLA